jgi:hypothetical protein
MSRLPDPKHRCKARPEGLRVIPGGAGTATTPTATTPPGPSPSRQWVIAIGTPLTSCMLVRTDLPGLLLVHLHAAGLRVALDGDPGRGFLRVHAREAEVVRSIAAENGIRVLEVKRIWLAPPCG